MTDDGWCPAETAPYDKPVLVRQSDGGAHVARRRALALGGEIWSRSPNPPVRVTGWRPIEPIEAPELAEAAARMAEALSYARQIVAKYAWTQGDNAEYHAEIVRPIDGALAAYEATKEKTDG